MQKEKGVECHFHAPWPVSERKVIARKSTFVNGRTIKRRKEIIEEVLEKALEQGDNLSYITMKELIEKCVNITGAEYYCA